MTDTITQRLAELLTAQGQDPGEMMDAEDRAAEGLPSRQVAAQREARAEAASSQVRERYNSYAGPQQSTTARYPAGEGFSPTRDQAADDPGAYFGRGPTGRLRNFRAMNDSKLATTLSQVRYEGNDREALDALLAEAASRELAI